MKKPLILLLGIIIATASFAQTQHGYVKTKGRLDDNGNVIPGEPIGEVVVRVKNRNEVISDKKGNFSFPMPDKTYYLDSVAKVGYVLVDPDMLSKQYNYSKNKLVIPLEEKNRQIEEQLKTERQLRRTLTEQLHQNEQEIELLKQQNKISEEEYRQALHNLYQETNQNNMLVKEMVERYSKIDFDNLKDYDLLISKYILQGELIKADSLVNSKGNLDERADNLKQLNEINAKKRIELTEKLKQLEKNEAQAVTIRDDLANDLYYKFEIKKMQHLNDSAAYYLEKRVSLDSTNVKWMLDAAKFNRVYIADYDKAMSYYQLALARQLAAVGENDPETVRIYNEIGLLLSSQGDFKNSLLYHEKALNISTAILGKNNQFTVACYGNVGTLYWHLGDYDKAWECQNKALEIANNIFDENQSDFAMIYNEIGIMYMSSGDFNKALEYFDKSLQIKKQCLDETNSDIAISYNNIGSAYNRLGDFDKSLEYFNKSLNIYKESFNENHPSIATNYSNIGSVLDDKGRYDEALEYYFKALEIRLKLLGDKHWSIATNYSNIGYVYNNLGDYEKALEYYQKALSIREECYGVDDSRTVKIRNLIENIKAKLAESQKK